MCSEAVLGGEGWSVAGCFELPESAGNGGEGRDGFGLSWAFGVW